VKPYFAADGVTLYLGDCREVTEWLAADVLVTDPPYGRDYNRRRWTWTMPAGRPSSIKGDEDTSVRDEALAMWENRPAVVFGDLKLGRPDGTCKTLIYRKPPDSGTHGAVAGFRHDIEAIYLAGKWPGTLNGHSVVAGGRSSVIETGARSVGNPAGPAARYGHPHAKPVDVMETLIAACPAGPIADPFAGSGSTLVAARNLGRKAIGVELEERYAERAAKRLCQGILEFA
jgi:DNA modification methylase